MVRLSLWFSGQPAAPQLVRASFEHPSLKVPHNVVRGRVSPVHSNTGTFQWTSAVQALAILILKTAAFQRGSGVPPVIEGRSGSLASSLDFSLSKLPAWLIELFGRDAHEYPLARRLIQRGNPGSKRAGPVTLGLSERMRKDLVVEIFLNNEPVLAVDEIDQIAFQIESFWKPHHAVGAPTVMRTKPITKPLEQSALGSNDAAWIRFRNRIREELQFSLRFTDIFTKASFQRAVAEIVEDPTFIEIAGKNRSILAPCEELLLKSGVFSTVFDAARVTRVLGRSPLKVVMAAVPSAVTMLFSHLRLSGHPVEIQADFSDVGEILGALDSKFLTNPPDLITFGVATAAQVLGKVKKAGFRPVMLTPKHSARAVFAKSKEAAPHSRKGRYLVMNEIPTSGSMYLDGMIRSGLVRRKEISVQHATPAQMFHEIREGDPDLRAIVHFPHHDLNMLFNNASYLDSDRIQSVYFPGILFAHETLCSDEERIFCLTQALRHAWLELRDDGPALDRALDSLLASPGFKERLITCAGASQLIDLTGEKELSLAL